MPPFFCSSPSRLEDVESVPDWFRAMRRPGTGSDVIKHVCRMGLEGIVSKRVDAPYRSGPSKTWLKSKNQLSDAVRREREEEWR